jgi:putative intracellular protease/amidase
MKETKVLFITTSHGKLGDTDKRTGVWLEELAVPYYMFKDAGAEITLASPLGGMVPLDPKSESIIVATPASKRFLKDMEAMRFLSNSIVLEDINAGDFDTVFLPGGHGPMWDIAGNKLVKQLLEDFNSQQKAIGAVCHGVAGLLSVQNGQGELLIKDKQLTGFSNSEEESAGLTGIVPFSLESALCAAGAVYTKAADHISHVVEDGNISTGQNPASSEAVVKKLIAWVEQQKSKAVYFKPSLIN